MNRLAMTVLAFCILVPLGFTPLVFADAEHYETLGPEALVDYRGSLASPLDGADSLDWSAPLVVAGPKKTLLATRGNPTLYVAADFSVPSGECSVYCGLWQQTGPGTYRRLGVADVQTASSLLPAGTRAPGRYEASRLLMFDLGVATHAELRKSDPTLSSTVALVPTLGASAPKGAD